MPSVRPNRRRRRAPGVVAAFVLAATLASACGDDSSSGLSQERAASLRSTLEKVEARVQDRDCSGAAEQAGALRDQVESLPSRVDRDLRDALEGSSDRLESLVAEQCQSEAPAVEAPPAEETLVPPENGGNQPGEGKKDKKPKKQKKPQDEQQPPDTGGTGQEGSTGVTGPDGGTTLP